MLSVSHHSSSDTTPPTVKNTNPADGATDVSVSASVYVTFSETVVEDVYFKDINIRNTSDNSVVNYIYNINNDMLTIDPISDFSSSSVTYAVYVPAGAVKDRAGNSLENDYVFTFTTVEEHTSGFTLTAPNGGENWPAGATKQITWSYAGEGCPTDARLSLYKGGVFQKVIVSSVTPESGTYSWTIPGSQAAGDDYQIRITSNTDTNVYDLSDANFTISKPITLTSPNGGENWQAGAAKELTWTYAGEGCPTDARLSLYKGGVFQKVIVSSVTPESGTYSWTIPGSQAAGNDYQIRITSNSDTNVYDLSDATFTINSSP
ncbi:Ig-like domain-containing protein [Pelotomaculum isophthalicicum JI]|uniref:Ig-like domain-containing protein n=1 Tax=Pelotomaculum isophthalicicum JI TaxID=947010 RepID=A0A9X4GXW2_9FIRM|nr:Ser-Thr-rich GPI-anchored membrane family protein [Pelotomaculum isophthalicicum]MDF9407235.1 Ig-like domain-containing protein [Pelotomaculum isophthalicicum JI]